MGVLCDTCVYHVTRICVLCVYCVTHMWVWCDTRVYRVTHMCVLCDTHGCRCIQEVIDFSFVTAPATDEIILPTAMPPLGNIGTTSIILSLPSINVSFRY